MTTKGNKSVDSPYIQLVASHGTKDVEIHQLAWYGKSKTYTMQFKIFPLQYINNM